MVLQLFWSLRRLNITNSPTEIHKELDKGPLIAGTVFSILSTTAVAVMAVLWCWVAGTPTVLEKCLKDRTRRCVEEERQAALQQEAEERERDAEEELYKNISTQYSAFPTTSSR